MKSVGSLMSWTCSTAVVSTLVGCAIPRLEIQPEPIGATVYVDGKHVFTRQLPGANPAATSRKTPLPYYGTTSLRGTMPTNDWVDIRRQVTIDEPFSPWLLPFDFLLECVTYPFASDDRYEHRVAITVPARPEVTPGITPRDIPALEARAHAALGER
jgi:hypothetical protein